jgi:hypothetical protein
MLDTQDILIGILYTESRCTVTHSATHNPTDNRSDLQTVGRTYVAIRSLQVVDRAGSPQTEKAGVGGSTPSLDTIFSIS